MKNFAIKNEVESTFDITTTKLISFIVVPIADYIISDDI